MWQSHKHSLSVLIISALLSLRGPNLIPIVLELNRKPNTFLYDKTPSGYIGILMVTLVLYLRNVTLKGSEWKSIPLPKIIRNIY